MCVFCQPHPLINIYYLEVWHLVQYLPLHTTIFVALAEKIINAKNKNQK